MTIINKINFFILEKEAKSFSDRTNKKFRDTIIDYASKSMKSWDKESERIFDQIISRKDLSDLLDFIPINREKVLDAISKIHKKQKATTMTKDSKWNAAVKLLSSPGSLKRFTGYDKKYFG